MHCSKKYVNKSFPHNSKTKRDIAKISAVLKPMKSDYYVVKFWQKSEHFYFLGLKGLKALRLVIAKFSYILNHTLPSLLFGSGSESKRKVGSGSESNRFRPAKMIENATINVYLLVRLIFQSLKN